MRIGVSALLLGVGFVAGAGAWALGTGTPVQAQAMPVVETRFILGPQEKASYGDTGSELPIYFMRDKRTRECFLISISGRPQSVTAITKVEAGACSF
jgi:hypothetical protein